MIGKGHKEDGEEEEGKPGLDENGNPTSSTGPGPFPIMDPQLRPLSIYRHTPVFRPQKLTVPSMSDREQMENRQAPVMDHKLESRPQEGGKRKVRRKKGGEEGSVMKAEDIEGYRGKEDIDAILSFIEAEKGGKKKKSSEKAVDKSIGKKKIEEKEKVRRKKEKSVEKENNSTSMKTGIGKKLSVDNSSEAEILEEVEEEEEEEAQTPSLLEKVSLAEEERKDTLVKGSPASLGSCGRANSAPSNDSGHVSAEPYSLPSVSSTKEMSIASSPPLDLDPAEDLTAEDVILHSTEFTKVTKKQRRKRAAGARERSERPHVYHQGSAFAEENRSRGEQQPRNGGQSENEDWGYRGYTRLRGSREAVTGAKSTCSVPLSDASDTDDHDSVHSLPVGSTRKREKEARSVSSGHTPQASYADIARHAAALYTQQAGQQQTAVYREALQCRETTPASSNNKESVSSAEGDSISFHYSSTSAHTGTDEHHAHTLTRAASEPSDSYRPPLTAPERSPLPAPERSPLVPAAPSQQLQSPPSSKQEKRTAAPPTSSAPPVVILDTTSTTVSPPVQGFTFGFEVNEDLLKENVGEEKEERLLDQDSNGDTGAVIPQNSVKDNDNVMMKNLLSLTSKSQDNDSNRSSEPLKSETEDEVEEERVNSGLQE